MKPLFLVLLVCTSSLFAWEKVLEKDGIDVFSKNTNSSVLPFKAIGKVPVSMEKLVKVLLNSGSKHEWAPKLKTVKMHEKINDNEFIFSEYYGTPWPATDRQFLLKGNVTREAGSYIFAAHSLEDQKYLDDNHVQVLVKKIELKLVKLAARETEVTFEFSGDLGGWLPNWLKAIIQKKWPLKFIKALTKRALKEE